MFCAVAEGYLVACMSHYIVGPTRLCDPCTCPLPGMCDQRHYDQVCMSGSQNYIVLPTVGYPTCSDKWRPDK